MQFAVYAIKETKYLFCLVLNNIFYIITIAINTCELAVTWSKEMSAFQSKYEGFTFTLTPLIKKINYWIFTNKLFMVPFINV